MYYYLNILKIYLSGETLFLYLDGLILLFFYKIVIFEHFSIYLTKCAICNSKEVYLLQLLM